VDFVTRYAQSTIERRNLSRVMVLDAAGVCLGEVLPKVSRTPV
jgi:hypothetical protein